MKSLLLTLAAVAMLAAGVLIWVGETDDTLWATYSTRNAAASLEIRP